MERVVDPDQAAVVMAERTTRWVAAGLTVGRLTWRDGEVPWPYRIETDRALVNDPDSVGVHISRPDGAELSVVLFRGGWADVDYYDGLDDGGSLPAAGIDGAAEFGARLDAWVVRVFGALREK